MSPDVMLECPRTSFGDVLRVNVTERVWHSPPIYVVCISSHIGTVEWQIMFVVNFDKRLDQKGWPAAPPPPHLFGTKYQFLRKHFGGGVLSTEPIINYLMILESQNQNIGTLRNP